MSGRVQGYSITARLFHWITALLVFGMIGAGFVMIQEGLSRSTQNTLFIFHKNAGVLVFVLVLARVAYRLSHPAPPLPDSVPPLQRRIARATHGALYALLLLMPVAGYIRVRAGGFPIEGLDAMGFGSLVPRSDALAEMAKTAHFYGALTLTAIVAVHIGAALLHGLILKDGVFARMWPPVGGRGQARARTGRGPL